MSGLHTFEQREKSLPGINMLWQSGTILRLISSPSWCGSFHTKECSICWCLGTATVLVQVGGTCWFCLCTDCIYGAQMRSEWGLFAANRRSCKICRHRERYLSHLCLCWQFQAASLNKQGGLQSSTQQLPPGPSPEVRFQCHGGPAAALPLWHHRFKRILYLCQISVDKLEFCYLK